MSRAVAAKYAEDILGEAGKSAGLDVPIQPHRLRRGAGRVLINGGATDMHLVQEVLDHNNIATTGVCSALTPAGLDAARAR